MQKLSVQEFSYLTQELPSTYEKSRGYSAENVEDKDFFRRRNKYITLFNDKPNGVSHNNHSASLSDENNNIHQSSDSGSNSNSNEESMNESLNDQSSFPNYINDKDNGPLEAENIERQDFSENSEDFQNSNPYYNYNHRDQSQILSQEEYTNQNRPELNENAYAYSDYTISNAYQDYLYNKKSRSFYPQRYTGNTNTDSDSGSYNDFRFRNNKSSSKLKTLKTTGSKLGKNLNHKNIIKLNPTRTNLKLLAGTKLK